MENSLDLEKIFEGMEEDSAVMEAVKATVAAILPKLKDATDRIEANERETRRLTRELDQVRSLLGLKPVSLTAAPVAEVEIKCDCGKIYRDHVKLQPGLTQNCLCPKCGKKAPITPQAETQVATAESRIINPFRKG
jgi:hypothetical protein